MALQKVFKKLFPLHNAHRIFVVFSDLIVGFLESTGQNKMCMKSPQYCLSGEA